jgi:hypothetical protein
MEVHLIGTSSSAGCLSNLISSSFERGFLSASIVEGPSNNLLPNPQNQVGFLGLVCFNFFIPISNTLNFSHPTILVGSPNDNAIVSCSHFGFSVLLKLKIEYLLAV